MVCCVNAKREPSSDLMIVRRLIGALVVLTFALSGFPPGPAQAAVSYADMPCHEEATPAPVDDDAVTQPGPSCCLPLCWLALEPALSLSGERRPPVFVGVVSTSFVSVSDRPQVPPPKRA